MNIAGNLAQPLLDNSHLKLRSHLAQNAAVAKRRPPSKITSAVSISVMFVLYVGAGGWLTVTAAYHSNLYYKIK